MRNDFNLMKLFGVAEKMSGKKTRSGAIGYCDASDTSPCLMLGIRVIAVARAPRKWGKTYG